MPTITVIRHSLTLANEQGLLMGSQLNSPLSENGLQLARAKGKSLKSTGSMPVKAYTSKLIRTRQTADTIIEELGLNIEIAELEGLNERDFGIYDGKPIQQLLDGFEEYGPNPPSVETVECFIERIVDCFNDIKNDAEQSILIVTHTNPVNVLKAALFRPEMLQTFWETDNPSYCEGFSYTF